MKIIAAIKNMKREVSLLLTSVVCSGLISALFINMLMPPKVVTINMQSIINMASQQYAKLPPQQQAQQAQIFASALTQATKQYARDNEAVVIVSPAVVAGGYDATNEIAELTAKIEKDSQ